MDDNQLQRYSRHILLPAVDIDGQQALLDSRVLVIGAGGLGCPAAMYLAASGVGTLHVVDFDEVELSNLQRQIGHRHGAVGSSKVESLGQSLRDLNPDLALQLDCERADDTRLQNWVASADVVLDCSDNFATRFAINRACVAAATPLVVGAAIRTEGQIVVFDRRQSDQPCYRCLYADDHYEDRACATNGVVAPLVGVIGAMQALEAVKLICDGGAQGTVLHIFDAWRAQWRALDLPRRPDCEVCGVKSV